LTVRGKKVTPAPSTVDLKVGERLTLTGKQPGTYEVETHHPELRLLKIAVR
jgi:hypothetical protein